MFPHSPQSLTFALISSKDGCLSGIQVLIPGAPSLLKHRLPFFESLKAETIVT